ncbi:BtrH N-terminal domain-containing protein [Oryzomicrobium sp.]|uniref:BtrH N-terminal domain-containing protein n=1 Tax=Oryzomicrobium sp. TaxID=1911578 RepID=UPI0025DCB4E3|nr:BtrH N-terminal domain-containing protein [Oryzomicrobium sp.]MCE1242448.1 BtrH N-terminal domain-containing protein [Oryzomicrobium sp.]
MNAALPTSAESSAETSAAFQHRHAAHCESGAISTLVSHAGLPLSEAMAFGLSGALAFAYLPFVKLQGLPLIAYRMPPRAIIRGLAKPLGLKLSFETFRRPEAGQARLDQLLDAGEVVGLQTSVFWLSYFPEDMRFHFNGHNLLVIGREGDDYLISDPVFETPQRCSRADLARARFAKGLLAPKGLLYRVLGVERDGVDPQAVLAAIRRTARAMLAPVPIVGVRAMGLLAKRIAALDPQAPASAAFVGHVVRMQEEIGTGGAGFRFLYAAFLQEAAELCDKPVLAEFSARLLTIGDHWRVFALRAARMLKGRETLDPSALAALLREQAERETAFFRDLRGAL